MPHSLQVWAIPPGETNREVIAVFYDEAKLAEQKKTELEKEGYKEIVISMLIANKRRSDGKRSSKTGSLTKLIAT